MNPLISLTVLFLTFGFTLAAVGASPSVSVDVKIDSKADYKGSSTKTQSRKLTVEVYSGDTRIEAKYSKPSFEDELHPRKD